MYSSWNWYLKYLIKSGLTYKGIQATIGRVKILPLENFIDLTNREASFHFCVCKVYKIFGQIRNNYVELYKNIFWNTQT